MIEIIQCLFGGAGVALTAIFETLKLYSVVNEIKNIIFAQLLGIPVWLFAVIGIVITIVKIFVGKLIAARRQ